MSTEEAVIKLVLDARDFNASLSSARSETDKLGDKLSSGAKSTNVLGDGVRGLSDRVKDLRPRIAGVTTAVSGMSGALQGALGPTAAWATGLNGLVGSFAIGGIFAVGIAGATAGVGALVNHFVAVRREAREAEISAAKAALGIKEAAKEASDEDLIRLAKIGQVSPLLTAEQARKDRAARAIENERAFDDAVALLIAQEEAAASFRARKERAEKDAADKKHAQEAEDLRIAIAMNDDAVHLHEERLAADASADAEHEEDRMRAIDRIVRANEDAFDARMNAFDIAIADEEMREEHLAEVRKRIDDERLARQQVIADFQRFAIDLAVDSMSMFLDAAVTGEEKALEKIAAFALKRVGTELVAVGTTQIVKGTGLAIESVGADPRGAGLILLGTAAIGLGIGMGAAGTAVSHLAAGGMIGKSLETETSDFGSRGISAGVSRGERRERGAATTSSQTFIFNAPVVADHVTTPRFFLDQLRRGQRNQLEATP